MASRMEKKLQAQSEFPRGTGRRTVLGTNTMSRSGESAEALLGGGAGERQLFCRVVTVLRRKIKQAKRTGRKIRGRRSNRDRGGTAEASGAGAE